MGHIVSIILIASVVILFLAVVISLALPLIKKLARALLVIVGILVLTLVIAFATLDATPEAPVRHVETVSGDMVLIDLN